MSKSSSLFRDLIIADASITDIDQLLDRVVPGAEVWRIDAGKDILGVLRSAISSGFERLHLLGHGKLGWIHFNSQALGADDFASLAGSNADGAPSLHFWSCKTGFGKQGRDFVDGLSKAFNTVVTAFSGLVPKSVVEAGVPMSFHHKGLRFQCRLPTRWPLLTPLPTLNRQC